MIPRETYEQAAAFLRGRLPVVPDTALVLGSGLGLLADEVEDVLRLSYAAIPGFPRSTVASHAGELVAGKLAGRPVMVLSGRFHFYEGYDMETVCFYVRVLHLLGVRRLLLTNAAGGVNTAYRVGDFMLLADHIKLSSVSPARGAGDPAFGPRFFDLTTVYTPRLRVLARDCAGPLGVPVHEGVYFYMAGPQFETPAEIRAIRLLGGDAVGMSTVGEAIAAAQCGMEVLAVSCITNLAAGMVPGTAVTDDEVTVNADKASGLFIRWMKAIVSRL